MDQKEIERLANEFGVQHVTFYRTVGELSMVGYDEEQDRTSVGSPFFITSMEVGRDAYETAKANNFYRPDLKDENLERFSRVIDASFHHIDDEHFAFRKEVAALLFPENPLVKSLFKGILLGKMS